MAKSIKTPEQRAQERDRLEHFQSWHHHRCFDGDESGLLNYLASFKKLPPEMRDARRWVGWRLEPTEEKEPDTGSGAAPPKDKPRKVPVSFEYKGRAQSNKSDGWSTLDDACRGLVKDYKLPTESTMFCEGLGFMLDGEFVGIDLDDVVSGYPAPEGKKMVVEPWAVEFGKLAMQLKGYCDITQSGTGLHFIFRGTLPDVAQWHKKVPHPSGVGELEAYSTGRYFAMCPHQSVPQWVPTTLGELKTSDTLYGMLEALLSKRTPTLSKSQTKPRQVDLQSSSAQRVLDKACKELAAMSPNSGRNIALNSAAFTAGGFVKTKALDHAKARQQLVDAGLQSGLSEGEVVELVDRSMEDGQARPLVAQASNVVDARPSEFEMVDSLVERLKGAVVNLGTLTPYKPKWAMFLRSPQPKTVDHGVWVVGDLAAQWVWRQAAEVERELVPSKHQQLNRVAQLVRAAATLLFQDSDPLDAEGSLLGVGTMEDPHVCNLKTGEVRPMVASDMCSKLTGVMPVDADKVDPRLWEFLRGIMRPRDKAHTEEDDERLEFVLDWFASALLGRATLQVLFLQGTTRNGKGVLMELALKAMGDQYADTVDGAALVNSGSHPTVRADIQTKRLVWHDEVDSSRPMATAIIKNLTGGAKQKARKMNQDYPGGKEATTSFAMTTNTTPRFENADKAMANRCTRVILPNEFAEDYEYKKMVLGLAPSFLRVAIDRAPGVYSRGPFVPPCVKIDAAEYTQRDNLTPWIEENLELQEGGFVSWKELVERCTKAIRDEAGEDPLDPRACENKTRNLKAKLLRDLSKVWSASHDFKECRPNHNGHRTYGVLGIAWKHQSQGDTERDLPI